MPAASPPKPRRSVEKAADRGADGGASERDIVTFCDTADVQMRAAAQIPARSLARMAVKARMLRTEWESISSLSDFPEAETLLDSLLTDLGAPPTQTSAARPARNDCPTSESRGYAPGAGTSGAVSGQWRWTC